MKLATACLLVFASFSLAADRNQTIAGRISDITADSFKLQDEDSKTLRIETSPTLKTTNLEGKQQKLSDLKDNSIVAVTLTREDGKNIASSVREARLAKGKITSINNKSLTLDSEDKLSINNNARITINNRQSKIEDLKEGDTINCYYYRSGEQSIIAEIRSKR